MQQTDLVLTAAVVKLTASDHRKIAQRCNVRCAAQRSSQRCAADDDARVRQVRSFHGLEGCNLVTATTLHLTPYQLHKFCGRRIILRFMNSLETSVCKAVKLTVIVWVLAPCTLESGYRRFERKSHINLHSSIYFYMASKPSVYQHLPGGTEKKLGTTRK